MAFASSGAVKLRTNLADYPVTMAVKQGKVSSPLVEFDFCGPKTAHDGFKDMEYIGIPLLKTATSVIFTTYPASEPLLKQARNSLMTPEPGKAGIHFGPFVTLSTCTGTTARARELEERYHGLCENMEGAAAAQVAGLHDIPWLEVRGISNMVEDRDMRKWDIPKAAEAGQKAVMRILEGWE
jgi:futalosine hydrolase